MEQMVMMILVVMMVLGLVIAGMVDMIKTHRASVLSAKWQVEMDERDKPLPEVFERLGGYDYGKGAFVVELTTSWHNRHRRAPYYIRLVSVEGSVVCTSSLYDNVDDARTVGMGQARWAGMLSGRIPAEYLHIY